MMKLSAAIRIGGMVKKQTKFAFKGKDGGTCALGGALEAVNLPITFNHRKNMFRIREAFNVSHKWHLCPVGESGLCDGYGAPELTLIAHLNDFHSWTRDQIADFVEGIENQMELEAKEKTELQKEVVGNGPDFVVKLLEENK